MLTNQSVCVCCVVCVCMLCVCVCVHAVCVCMLCVCVCVHAVLCMLCVLCVCVCACCVFMFVHVMSHASLIIFVIFEDCSWFCEAINIAVLQTCIHHGFLLKVTTTVYVMKMSIVVASTCRCIPCCNHQSTCTLVLMYLCQVKYKFD